MEKITRVVTDNMIGLKLPDYARHSPRVATVLGKNPSAFTGPGTNTYIVGTSSRPLLLDTGQGVAVYIDLLEAAMKELAHSSELDRIVLTHAHVDHLGGVKQVTERFGSMEVLKMPWEGHDAPAGAITPIGHDAIVETDGVTLRAVHTPGHAPDHLCYYLEEERALFTGDVVLGAGTTVIPDDTGDLADYMDSLRRLLELDLETIYPAHGPVIRKPRQKIREYIAHRELRERQVLEALKDGPLEPMAIVKKIYTDVPEYLHQAAASSVRSHLGKLKRDGRVVEHEKRWSLV
ncbi:MAG: MBL fold metallo-hydrolase [Candidatus Binatus sp.]|uniref:MBL fold metallo-hydrolase n=1 Tax=Candidatus Binatus sp. TaxID=2811406 RepID=UPI00271CF1A6|nr:MBL fold metallo-hydrolase [Candidatus Binatus sp.]MDO8431433.1 MBL fold metallo-hydrolase [Candidatus Binatus sp.]